MTAKPRALLSWSSGKDSAWALHVLRQRNDVSVVGLLTTFNQEFARVAMHAVRQELVVAQAAAVGLSLVAVQLPWPCPNDAYEAAMSAALTAAIADGITHIAFGDLFLEDIRSYREQKMAEAGLLPMFPLWGMDTAELAQQMIAAGTRATIVCVDPAQLEPRLCGRTFDSDLLRELPPGVDRCGERGEFHTFVQDGPAFGRPVPVAPGEIVERDGFVFADLLPVESRVVPA
ncbi:MAG: adenine nucleotide alpha hydrolase [Candidatus Dormibacteraeota bacterium]|nr:adenine nucleotide alpha hydrolase [Candidatus Dormibacteraeota bacterium]